MVLQKILSVFFLISASSTFAQQTWSEDLIITPEKSNFVKTSTYDEVMNFLYALAKKTDRLHVFSMGKSKEGKEIPVAVLSKEKITTAAEARASDKPVIYIQGNIHAGEVEGKEVVMMLMRDSMHTDCAQPRDGRARRPQLPHSSAKDSAVRTAGTGSEPRNRHVRSPTSTARGSVARRP